MEPPYAPHDPTGVYIADNKWRCGRCATQVFPVDTDYVHVIPAFNLHRRDDPRFAPEPIYEPQYERGIFTWRFLISLEVARIGRWLRRFIE